MVFEGRGVVWVGDVEEELEPLKGIRVVAGRPHYVANTGRTNAVGGPVAYKLVPGENVQAFQQPDSSFARRAGFAFKHVWVTRFDPRERYAAGDYPNQHAGGAGLPSYVADDAPLENTDVVVWYTFGAHHVVRPEDWPVTPVARIGFMLKPAGFFDKNPGLDVPRPTRHGAGGASHCCP